ncbi:hypothetical protein RRG08_031158 [Elysia crispata]|uniref:Uncharacterized protein n=1 Tax=Elysia crispata TaxID=231223 RepID=A0AAE0ZF94_9GAST|nr:hypothetical protein RRG08_031156 [Elysia crispata]KAK3768369.1 hypothetical protein RRG08_031157 [Elysia crispata]KAK3768370.1 hypothetical protein RRG08_031158 [Elysia crispata]
MGACQRVSLPVRVTWCWVPVSPERVAWLGDKWDETWSQWEPVRGCHCRSVSPGAGSRSAQRGSPGSVTNGMRPGHNGSLSEGVTAGPCHLVLGPGQPREGRLAR